MLVETQYYRILVLAQSYACRPTWSGVYKANQQQVDMTILTLYRAELNETRIICMDHCLVRVKAKKVKERQLHEPFIDAEFNKHTVISRLAGQEANHSCHRLAIAYVTTCGKNSLYS